MDFQQIGENNRVLEEGIQRCEIDGSVGTEHKNATGRVNLLDGIGKGENVDKSPDGHGNIILAGGIGVNPLIDDASRGKNVT